MAPEKRTVTSRLVFFAFTIGSYFVCFLCSSSSSGSSKGEMGEYKSSFFFTFPEIREDLVYLGSVILHLTSSFLFKIFCHEVGTTD